MRLLEKSNTLKVLDIIKESDDEYTGEELNDVAKWVYDNVNRDSEWDNFTDNELVELISFCCITDKNPWGRAYDDEVFDAADRRPNGEELIKRGQELAKKRALEESINIQYLDEAENPENKEINALIKGLLTGQTKAKKKLEKMGYTVEFDNDAYKQFGGGSFGKYVTITNNKTGKKIVGSYGSRWGNHDFISAKPVEDNSASSDPVKKQQWHNSFHKLTGRTHPSDKMADPNKFDYKGYLDKETPDLSEPESEFQRFKKDKAFLKDKEYEAKRIDAARERVANVRAKMGKEPVEESLKEEEKVINVKYIGKDDWDRHIVRDENGRYYGDVNLTRIGKDKDLSMADWHTYSGNDPYEGEPYYPVRDVKFNITNPEDMPNQEQEFEYMLLGRLKMDCDYFLGNGNGYEGHLWAGSVDKQIAKMRELYNILEEKPEWCTEEDINNYEERMKNFKPVVEESLKESGTLWTSEVTDDDYDKEQAEEYYKDYLEGFDGTIKPDSYEEWLESDWLYNYLYYEFNNEDNEYTEWYDFINSYDEEDLKRYYQDYLDDIKEREPDKPKDFEDWFEDYKVDSYEDTWEMFNEDLRENVLPMIDSQVKGAIFIIGDYHSNYPDFRKSGPGGKVVKDADDLIDWLSEEDKVVITYDDNDDLSIAGYDHDGSISGDLYTLPDDPHKILEIALSTDMYDKNDYEDNNELVEDFLYDLSIGNVYTRDIKKPELLIPIKNGFRGDYGKK